MKPENYYNKETKTMNYFTEKATDINILKSHEKLNESILKDFYKAVDWLLSRGYEEYVELNSNTINPAKQNPFYPLREYRVKRNGHYKTVKIYYRFLGGCCIEEIAI